MLVAFLAYKAQFTGRTSALIDKLMEFRLVRVHLDRIADIALAEAEHRQRGAASAFAEPTSLELAGVSFRYSEADPWVVQNVSLKVADGSCVAIRAPSGRGKTTLIKIMMGLLKPTSGRVLLNGVEIEHSPARAAVAAVMQEDTLLSGTLAENIAFFEPIIDQDRVRHCADLAGISADVERMPMKYSTLVGDMGAALSGGQKQRILLARALYSQPKILFLDEATSHLDSAAEKHVHTSLADLRITRVIVAHRNETLALADVVLTLDDIDRAGPPPASGGQEDGPNVTRITWGTAPN
jgi:ATP-binding cassette subfamily B protein RaxB